MRGENGGGENVHVATYAQGGSVMNASREVRVHLKELGEVGGKSYVVVGTRSRWLPIFTTPAGVQAIGIAAGHPEYVEMITDAGERRPMSADLFCALAGVAGTEVSKLVVTGVRGRTFIADLHLSRDGEAIVLDCRPTDGIAVALTAGAPIYVADSLLKRACMSPDQFAQSLEGMEAGGAEQD